MTEAQKTAKGLVDALGKQRALSHVAFVLSPAFGLDKAHLRLFWGEVGNEIHEYTVSGQYKTLVTNGN